MTSSTKNFLIIIVFSWWSLMAAMVRYLPDDMIFKYNQALTASFLMLTMLVYFLLSDLLKANSEFEEISEANEAKSKVDVKFELELAASREIELILSNINSWNFNIFELHEKCNVLTQVALRVFEKSNLFKIFKIPKAPFIKFFRNIENGYHNIPYHNRVHAADVLHGVFFFTQSKISGSDGFLKEDSGRMGDVMDDLELMALYTSAAIHDFDHPGRTNPFLIATSNPKALLYNDRSVLENHHVAAAWSLIVKKPEMNFLQTLKQSDYNKFRTLVITLVLSTDLRKHFGFLFEWNAKISGQSGGFNYSKASDRLILNQMILKMADISASSKNWSIHRKWTDLIFEEFYLQGEEEKALGMPVSTHMDRHNPNVPECQASFIKCIVSPLFTAYQNAGLMPGEWRDRENSNCKAFFSELTENLKNNHEHWLRIISKKEESGV